MTKRKPESRASFEEADQLLARVAQSGDFDDADRLLGYFFRGYSVEHLRPLLGSTDQSVVQAATYLASELGRLAAPLVDEFGGLLRSPWPVIRYGAVDSILLSAGSEHGELIASTLRLLFDPERTVRARVLKFLSRMSDDQREAALLFLINDPLQSHVAWLGSQRSQEHDGIIEALSDANELRRRMGVAAAARLRGTDQAALRSGEVQDELALKSAAASEDKEVAAFARKVLENLTAVRSERAKRAKNS